MTERSLPRHIAIIPDGNGRWAKQRSLPRFAGHKAGVDAIRQVIKSCIEEKIEVLSLFAFSSENWRRPPSEINFLMNLFITVLEGETKKLHEQNIQLRIIGDRSPFDKKLQKLMQVAENLTANNTGLKLIIAANYGGQWDIQQAMQKIAKEHLSADIITAELIHSKLSLADLPAPDLLIRTSGEQRVSNFYLWQLAYTELYFTPVFWPDFNKEEFIRALSYYAGCERRFGHISEQLKTEMYA